MTDDATVVMALGCFGAVSVTVASIASVLRARYRSRAGLPSAMEARLARIETAVDAIAIEVERVAESQRYSLRREEEGRRLGA